MNLLQEDWPGTYHTRSKNICLQGYFYDAVKSTATGSVGAMQSIGALRAAAAYYTRSKNACSQGHFYDAVKSTATGSVGAMQSIGALRAAAAYYTRSKNACSQGHFYDAVNKAAARQGKGGIAAGDCKARLSACIIPQKRQESNLFDLFFTSPIFMNRFKVRMYCHPNLFCAIVPF